MILCLCCINRITWHILFIAPKTVNNWLSNLSSLNAYGEGYSRNASCALILISTFYGMLLSHRAHSTISTLTWCCVPAWNSTYFKCYTSCLHLVNVYFDSNISQFLEYFACNISFLDILNQPNRQCFGTYMVYKIYFYRNLQFLNYVISIKTQVCRPRT